eukprot:3322774-Lingulodinium_polyedra.AAC.1
MLKWTPEARLLRRFWQDAPDAFVLQISRAWVGTERIKLPTHFRPDVAGQRIRRLPFVFVFDEAG